MNYYLKDLIRKLRMGFAEPGYSLCYLGKRLLSRAFAPLSSFSPFLSEVTILLTFRCNLRCRICPQWGDYGLCKDLENSLGEELTLEELKSLIDQVADYHPLIVLGGGEPLLYKDWYNLAKYIKSKGLRTCLITNGVLLERYSQEVVEVISDLHISLDAPPKIHDQIRGEGAFEKAFLGIEEICRLKKEKRKRSPNLKITPTISDLNFKDLEGLIKFFQEKDLDIHTFVFQHLMFLGKEALVEHRKRFEDDFKLKTNFWEGYQYFPEDLKVDYLIKEIERIKSRYKRVTFHPQLSPSEIRLFYTQDSWAPPRFLRSCLAPYLEATILPDGNLWLCPDYVLGNIKKVSFRELWNGKEACLLRENLRKRGLFPACRSCCYLYAY